MDLNEFHRLVAEKLKAEGLSVDDMLQLSPLALLEVSSLAHQHDIMISEYVEFLDAWGVLLTYAGLESVCQVIESRVKDEWGVSDPTLLSGDQDFEEYLSIVDDFTGFPYHQLSNHYDTDSPTY